DLGAESCRVVPVAFDGERLSLGVAHRSDNTPRFKDGILRWDFAALWSTVTDGLGKLANGDVPISSVGVDSWGVDYGLLSGDGSLVDDPTCYRDARNIPQLARALDLLGAREIYGATGTQILEINGIFALMDDAQNRPERLRRAETLLMMPDLFHHELAGTKVTEFTAASTSGLYDMVDDRWATSLMDQLGIPTHMLPEVVPAGTDVGVVRGDLNSGMLSNMRVILPPGHDTASAVVAVPFEGPHEAYISSGTWSLVGVMAKKPYITEASQQANLTNEGGYRGDIRLLRNVMGLWIVQACRKQWAAEGQDLTYTEIAAMTKSETPLRSVINPDALDFLAPGDMPAKIRQYCARNGIPVPQTIGQTARCVVDSLALSYRLILEDVAAVNGCAPTAINVVGGGSNHKLLQQATADATGLSVRCGSVEATALGNATSQLIALGEFTDADIPDLLHSSTNVRTYLPAPGADWDNAAGKLRSLITIDLHRRGL
ncbi:rhamnulokinase, partial [Arthrobacter sp. H14]|uniref:rhamnulokinase n=1 Tax=Arthrobacter sp. H14 TaxID=1312959 RepID=UPI000688A55A